jgi:hypothetical protein
MREMRREWTWMPRWKVKSRHVVFTEGHPKKPVLGCVWTMSDAFQQKFSINPFDILCKRSVACTSKIIRIFLEIKIPYIVITLTDLMNYNSGTGHSIYQYKNFWKHLKKNVLGFLVCGKAVLFSPTNQRPLGGCRVTLWTNGSISTGYSGLIGRGVTWSQGSMIMFSACSEKKRN